MKVRIRLFAMLREKAGWRERELELPAGSSIEDVWRWLAAQVPSLEGSRTSVRFALNRSYAEADTALSDGDELALIPPVAGGSASALRAAAAEGRLRRKTS